MFSQCTPQFHILSHTNYPYSYLSCFLKALKKSLKSSELLFVFRTICEQIEITWRINTNSFFFFFFFHFKGSGGVPFTQLELLEATHRGLHKFIPRHHDEIDLEIGDPIYVQKEADDLWCEGAY